MDLSLVTCDDYRLFLKETGGFRQPDHWLDVTARRGDEPVLGVHAEDAQAFCRWLSGKTGVEWRLPRPGELRAFAEQIAPNGYWTSAGLCERNASAPAMFPQEVIFRALGRVEACYDWLKENHRTFIDALCHILPHYTFAPARHLPDRVVGVHDGSLRLSLQREPVALSIEAAAALASAFQHGLGDVAEYPQAAAALSLNDRDTDLYKLLHRALSRDQERARYSADFDTSHLKGRSEALFEKALPMIRQRQIPGYSIAACLRQYHRSGVITSLALHDLPSSAVQQKLDLFITMVVLDERIAGTLAASEGIVVVRA